MTNDKQNGLTEEKTVDVKKIPGTDAQHISVATHKEKEKKTVETDTGKSTTTDPQEKMEGPISSIMQNIKEAGESNDDESKEEADKKKDENT